MISIGKYSSRPGHSDISFECSIFSGKTRFLGRWHCVQQGK